MTMREDGHAVITALEHDWTDAWRTGNAMRCARLMADDFVEVSSRGQLASKGEWLASMAANAPKRIRSGESRVRLFGRFAVAYLRLHLAGSSRGNDYSAEFLASDIWTFHGAQWLVVSRQLTRVRAAHTVAS